jgi:hypothetical protein
MNIHERLSKAKEMLKYAETDQYLESLVGTIGADPLHR